MPNRTTWPHAEESADSTHHALQSNTHAQYGTAAELNFANRCGGGRILCRLPIVHVHSAQMQRGSFFRRRRGLLTLIIAPAAVVTVLGTLFLHYSSSISTIAVRDAESGRPSANDSAPLINETDKGTETVITRPVTSPASPAIRGFLLPVIVEQQLTGGLKGFTQLATLGAMFNLSTVEPYVSGSKLVGVPYISKGRDVPDVMKLSDLYDWDDLRRNFKTCSTRNNHQLSSFETFLNLASRHVILVHMVTTLRDYKLFFSNRSQNNTVLEVDHNHSFLSGLYRLNNWAAYVLQQNDSALFNTTTPRVVVIDARPTHALSLNVLVSGLASIIEDQISKFHSATLLFDGWRAVTRTVPRALFYYIPEFIWRRCQRVDTIRHSVAVRNASQLFAQSLGDTRHGLRIGVHIRGERLLKEYKGSVEHCIDLLGHFVHNSSWNESNVVVHIVHDLGHYGTSSCSSGTCFKKRNNFLSEVRKLGFPVVSFDPANFPSVPRSSGFVSFVEREYLSNVDVLVTLGWGGFQYTISQRFVQQHRGNTHNFHQICSSPSSTV